MGPFKIINKVIKVLYRLDLLLKIKIHPVYYIAILEPAYGNHELLIYKQDTYKGREEDEQLVKKILQYNKIDGQLFYKVQQEGYKETIQELEENLKYFIEKIQAYYQKLHQAILRKKGRN